MPFPASKKALIKSLPVLAFALLANVVYASDVQHTPVTDQHLDGAEAEAGNWLSHGKTYYEQRFSPLDQINDKNINDLGLSWDYEFEDNRGLEATPIVVDGVMYTTSAWSRVYAFNAKTGELLWKYDPQVDRKLLVNGCCGPVNRGVAVWGDKVYLGSFDGYLIALSRKTGQVIWKVKTADVEKDYTITGAPRVVNGKVLIGNGGAEYGVRGYLSAYDAQTGEMVWRFYTVPGNPELGFESEALEMAAETWTGEWWKLGGGGTVWDSFSHDPELNLVYIGVGNGSPWNHKIRSPEGGDNLFLSSIVAVDADTGEYKWHYQTTPGESWDFTATQQIILADIIWQGESRKVLMQAPKNGFFFIIDRETGEYLSAEAFTKVVWAKGYDENGRPIEVEGARYDGEPMMMMPSAVGGHNWHSMSFSPETGLVYIPVIKMMMEYNQPKNYDPKPHAHNIGTYIPSPTIINAEFMQVLKKKVLRGELVAWDPKKQQAAWTFKHERVWNGGTMVTAGNLVFQGTADNKFMAFDAKTGDKLWSYDLQLGVVAAPVTYSVDGEQYVAIMAKWGGALPMAIGIEPLPSLDKGRLLVFKLGGDETLPKATKRSLVMPDELPAMPAGISEADIQDGKDLYIHYCAICHGNDAVGSSFMPDLRYMRLPYHQMFQQIVREGALSSLGMAAFKERLTEEQVDHIYAYVLQQAHLEKERLENGAGPIKKWFYHRLADFMVAATDAKPSFYIGIGLFNLIFLFLIYKLFRRLFRKK